VGLDAHVSTAIAIATTTARAAWPQLDVGPSVEASFADALRAIVGADDGEVDPSAAIATLHLGDLWLATACGEGHPAAIAQLDAVLATLRERLLTGAADRPPRIRGYRGRGELRSWLKVALVRDATRALQRELGRTPVDELDQLMDPGPDLELAAMKDGYRLAFGVAFASALGELGARDRNVLRYHLVEGLSIDEIGALFRVHRSTAARWLVAIREGLVDATRRALMRQLALGPADVDSVLRMIRSRLDASLATGLDATP
jgi:RNA polymerase sigma-70 factor (ECF subfamily)